MINSGIIIRIEAAANLPHSGKLDSIEPMNVNNLIGSVYLAGDCNNTNANKNPFQALRKLKRKVIANAGVIWGRIIFLKTLKGEFPITRADSSNSFGIVSIYPLIIQRARGIVCVL